MWVEIVRHNVVLIEGKPGVLNPVFIFNHSRSRFQYWNIISNKVRVLISDIAALILLHGVPCRCMQLVQTPPPASWFVRQMPAPSLGWCFKESGSRALYILFYLI